MTIMTFISGQVISIDAKQFLSFDSPPYLTPTITPTNSIVINYTTEDPMPSAIAFGRDSSLKDTIRKDEKINFHHIIINNLLPGTEYYYQILYDEKIYKFRTFPIYPDSFNFIVIGDTRTDSASHQSVIDRIFHYDFEFILHTGDLVTYGYSTNNWKTFFNIERKIISSKLFIPVIGNHEKPFWQYDSLFLLPGLENFYSIRFGNVYIICLNTEMDLNGHQRKWLINELSYIKTDTSLHWVFVNCHRPPYSSGSHGSDMKVRKTWSPIFEKFGVDVVFCGHDHSYERTKKINGVIYIVCAGGGAPLYNVGRSEWTAYSERTHHFCLVKVKKKELFLQAIKPDGTIFDTLRLFK
ncbi:MAG: metallophosphoesterase family protein [candidate division WOR-3 bacterium]|nr:metallophosphoesterase family protein [candidate division WOR-3 bacterium]